MCCLQECLSARFSPEMLPAGAVKGLIEIVVITRNCQRRITGTSNQSVTTKRKMLYRSGTTISSVLVNLLTNSCYFCINVWS